MSGFGSSSSLNPRRRPHCVATSDTLITDLETGPRPLSEAVRDAEIAAANAFIPVPVLQDLGRRVLPLAVKENCDDELVSLSPTRRRGGVIYAKFRVWATWQGASQR